MDRFELHDCPTCNGEGAIEHWESANSWSFDPPCAIVLRCEACRGAGVIVNEYELIAA